MKRRRKGLWAALTLLLIVVVLLAGLGLALKQEPEFYGKDTIRPTDPHDASLAQTKLLEIQNSLESPKPSSGEWIYGLSQDELNSFLREDPNNWNAVGPAIAPFRDPRVSFEDDTIVVAARSGSGFFSTVVWAEFRVWLVGQEPNLVAIEVVSLRAGAVPLSKTLVMERFTKMALARGAEMTWYRGEDKNPVGVLRLRARLAQPDMLLTVLGVADGRINVGGKSLLGP
jgi:hypothetical protein